MDSKQKAVVWVGVLVIVATGLYPPWVQLSGAYGGGGQRRYTYGWIVAPPVVMVYPAPPKPTPPAPSPPDRQSGLDWTVPSGGPVNLNPYPDPQWRTELDVGRLTMEWVMTLLLGCACFVAWPGGWLASAWDTVKRAAKP